MNTNELENIDKEIAILINDKNKYNFDELKQKVEKVLEKTNIFIIDGKVSTKAVDLYLKNVITKRNSLIKEQEKKKIDDSIETKYTLIESICKKLEFENQEDLINKVDELKKKTNQELYTIDNSF
ncbi:hypothetical protein ACH5BF_06355 [Arcobacter sp. YIC-464]|uniref:hypothetical protein n=1 Tax=Arcobacter sp. YIC-464 TaxID=3376631 RepID=UPI003C15C08C